MRSAVITSGEHWLTINGIEYLRGTIETIERLTYVQGNKEAVKISGSSVNQSVILVEGTTIDGVQVTSQDELVDFIKQYSFKNGGGSGEGATWGSISGDINNQEDLLELIQQSGGGSGVVSFEETATGGEGEVITHDTGDATIQDVILVPRNEAAMNQGEPRYTISNGVISITTMMTSAGDVLRYSYVAGSVSGSRGVSREEFDSAIFDVNEKSLYNKESINSITDEVIYLNHLNNFNVTVTTTFSPVILSSNSVVKRGVPVFLRFQGNYIGRFSIYVTRPSGQTFLVDLNGDFNLGRDILINIPSDATSLNFRTWQAGVIVNLYFFNKIPKPNIPTDVLRRSNIDVANGVASYSSVSVLQSNFSRQEVVRLIEGVVSPANTFGNFTFGGVLKTGVGIPSVFKAQYTGRFAIYGYRTGTDFEIIYDTGSGSQIDFRNGHNFEFTIDPTKNFVYLAFRTFVSGLTVDYLSFSEVKINPNVLPVQDFINYWKAKIAAFYGDSITAINNLSNGTDYSAPINRVLTRWGTLVANTYQFSKLFSRGVGSSSYAWGNGGGYVLFVRENGTYYSRNDGFNYDNYTGSIPAGTTKCRSAFCSWLRITKMFPESIKDTIDLVLVMGATNDSINSTDAEFVANSNVDTEFAQSPQYAAVGGDYNINTLKGGIASTIMKMQMWMPQATIVLVTPLPGRGVEGQISTALSTDETVKSVSVREIAGLMSIPVIDLNAKSGINSLNRTTYITDAVHPYNAAGNNMIYRVITGELKNILPIK